MTCTPQISVIIPTYNYARYLPDAIQSVLNQTVSNVEIIVVDDGSVDQTRDFVLAFPSVRYLYQTNRGLSAARNTGIKEARGEFLAFLDADDVLMPRCLEILGSLLENNPAIGAVYGRCQLVDDNLAPLPQLTPQPAPSANIKTALAEGNFFPVHTALTRRECFERVGLFDEHLRASEDWDMWLRICASYSMAGSAEVVAWYRIHDSNMSKEIERMYQSELTVVQKHFGPLEDSVVDRRHDRQRAYGGVYLRRAVAHYRRRETDEAQYYVYRALLACPEIVEGVDVFYTLACADQPVGWVGDLTRLDLKHSADRLISALMYAFNASNCPRNIQNREQLAYGTAYFTLGILNYNAHQLNDARTWLLKAISFRPDLVLDSQWLMTLAKASLGLRALTFARELRRVRLSRP